MQTHVAIEASKEKISLNDIRRAYQYLGFHYNGNPLDDDTIIGTFQSRISSSPKQEPELRRALKIIGQDRGSSKVQQVAANGQYISLLFSVDRVKKIFKLITNFSVVTNHEQALTWLGATEEMSVDFVVSMYHVKVSLLSWR